MLTTPTANQKRFLDLLSWCEGTSTHPLTQNLGYDVVVTGVDGPEVFTDYSRHPFAGGRAPKLIRAASPTHSALYSTASGRYQLLKRYWLPYCTQLRIAPPDFSPATQDAIALAQIGEHHGALDAIEAGDVETTVRLCNPTWASLPGNMDGQGGKTLAAVLTHWALLDPQP